MKSITFILASPSKVPNGGHKIIYEYADRLAEKYNVNIVYVISLPYQKHQIYKFVPDIFRYCIFLFLFKLVWKRWYNFRNIVKEQIVYQICDDNIPKTDIGIATFWSTSYALDQLENIKQKYYFIQSYETWAGSEEYVNSSYLLNMTNLVITHSLEEKINELGGKVEAIIPNGLDLNEFKLVNLPEKRDSFSIIMMYHQAKWKGGADGIKALSSIKKKYPKLKVTFFSVFPRSVGIPKWIEYVENPSQKELITLYNEHAIFLCTSWYEGFGLPGAEALACGCALVTTDNKGCREYAKQEETAIVVEPRDIDGIEVAIEKMILDDKYRIHMALEGNKFIQKFSWDNAVKKLESILEEA